MMWIWSIFALAVAVLSTFIGITVGYFVGGGWITGISMFVIIMVITIILGAKAVPENNEYLIEVFGKYAETWGPGLHLIFPYGNFMNIGCQVYMGTRMIEVFGSGDAVDFKDGSAPIKAFAYIRIEDSDKAVYNISDVYEAVAEQINSAIRSYLSGLSIDQANALKNQLSLEVIFSDIRPDKDGKIISLISRKELLESNEAIREIREKWGVIIEKIVIADISLPENIANLRAKILEAEKAQQVAEIVAKTDVITARGKAEAKVIEAEADKKAMEERGKGQKEALVSLAEADGQAIKKLTERGLIASEAAFVVTEERKWDAVKNGSSRVVVSDNRSLTGVGAELALGERLIQEP